MASQGSESSPSLKLSPPRGGGGEGATTTGPDATPPQLYVKTWRGWLEGVGAGGRVEGLGRGSAGGCGLNHGRSQILDAPAQAIPANVPSVNQQSTAMLHPVIMIQSAMYTHDLRWYMCTPPSL